MLEIGGLSEIMKIRRHELMILNCQALVPIPVPNPKSPKEKGQIGTGADTKITWATTPPPTSKKGLECTPLTIQPT